MLWLRRKKIKAEQRGPVQLRKVIIQVLQDQENQVHKRVNNFVQSLIIKEKSLV